MPAYAVHHFKSILREGLFVQTKDTVEEIFTKVPIVLSEEKGHMTGIRKGTCQENSLQKLVL